MKKNYLGLTAIVAALVLIATLALAFLPGGGGTIAAASYTLDHFKGYKILNPIPVQDPVVVLQDEFDVFLKTNELKLVGPGDMFFDPLEKTVITATGNVTTPTPILHPIDYLERFPISNLPGTPRETTRWNVVATNQFGQQNLILGPATDILVPTGNTTAAGNLPNINPNLDHFKWYPVISQVKPMNIQLILRDQFGNWTNVAVLTPVAFANPVNKSHLLTSFTAGNPGATLSTVTIPNPDDHIIAYSLRLIPRQINLLSPISNQFISSARLELQEGRMLLVPTTKLSYVPVPAQPNPPGTNPNDQNDD